MSNIRRLFRTDLRRAVSNVISVMVLCGLIVLPALFTWFNLIASWDPFSETKDLTVAVASADEGYESDLVPLRVNVGEQVISKLRENDQLDWRFVSEEQAIDGTKSGEYYAAIVLPETFSRDMMTFYSEGADPSKIDYYTNEKKNPLAPKITEQGADGVSQQINTAFAGTLSDVGLTLISTLADHLDSDQVKNALARLQLRADQAATRMRSGAQTAEMFSDLAGSSVPLARSASDLVGSARDSLSDAGSGLGSGSAAVDDLQAALSEASSAFAETLEATVAGYDSLEERIEEVFEEADSAASSQASVLRDLAARQEERVEQLQRVRQSLESATFPEDAQAVVDSVIDRLDAAIDRQTDVQESLEHAADRLESGASDARSELASVRSAISDARDAMRDAKEDYEEGLQPLLDELSASADRIGAGFGELTQQLAVADAESGDAGESLIAKLERAEQNLARTAKKFDDIADRFDELSGRLAAAEESGDLTALAQIIGDDPSSLAAAISSPIEVDRVAVYPVASFGAAMAPMYTTLALWVGALLSTVLIRAQAPTSLPGSDVALAPHEQYLGRYGLFAVIGLLQATLVAGGNILFVRIEPQHPFLLLVICWAAAIVFSAITYTFVVSFGNAGKALSVLLLVLQISSAGGAYPLQLLPQWFQNVSPFMPATHAVNGMRAAIAGEYGGDFWQSLGLLALFLVPVLLLGLVLRRPLIGFNRKLASALESTRLM